ncbi:hypothetical protein CEXT_421261, partial [Caerostris extrusa]
LDCRKDENQCGENLVRCEQNHTIDAEFDIKTVDKAAHFSPPRNSRGGKIESLPPWQNRSLNWLN